MNRFRRSDAPLHARFARGYRVGFVIAIAVAAAVYVSVNTSLDRVAESEGRAEVATDVVLDLRQMATVLGRVADSPSSLAVRADLVRAVNATESMWAQVLADPDMPTAVAIELEDGDGIAPEMTRTLADARTLGDVARGGASALTPNADALEAIRLELTSTDLAGDLTVLIGLYEARSDRSLDAMRLANAVTLAAAIGLLGSIILFVLRPLRFRLQHESEALAEANQNHSAESARQELASHLSDGLEAAETEDETHRVVGRAFERLLPDSRVELLLADSAKGQMASAVVHPDNGGPGCMVESPWACPAVRRGRTMTYEDSASINACPHLAGRPYGACSATCVPLSFMGESMGVMHVTGAVDHVTDTATNDVLGLVAGQVAVRIGTLRSISTAELQASTDSLTGLPNRRSTEAQLRRLVHQHETVAVAMADLDHFTRLNERFGEDAGDRALRIFAEAARASLRSEDVIGRWGGEEFVLVLPGLAVADAVTALDRLREAVATACARAEAPAVTVSLGVVDSSEEKLADELVRHADEALLAAKTQGRDRVVAGPVVGPLVAAEPVAEGVEES